VAALPLTGPTAGVAVLLERGGKVLLGRRVDDGLWGFPAGKLHWGEDPLACARRELLEECGLELEEAQFLTFTNDIYLGEGKHYVTFIYSGQARGEPELLEPEKCHEWCWFAWDEIPVERISCVSNLLGQGLRS
jgi:8-oxo-dGTP diphosphatase